MKTVVLTSAGRPSSKSSSSAVTAATARDRSEGSRGPDSCYYPGCRKDTNCHCDICIASINATLDLIPSGSTIQQKSSLTKLSSSRPSKAPRGSGAPPSPPSASPPSPTPAESETGSAPASPLLHSTAKSRPAVKKKAAAHKGGSRALLRHLLGWIVGLCFVFAADYGFPAAVNGILGGRILTPDMVRMAGEQSLIAGDLRGKLGFLQDRFGRVLGIERVSNCIASSSWELHQEGHFFRARCVIYKSTTEEVSIWGCPLQTSGLIRTGFSSRWFSVLSGRITEWSPEKLAFTSRVGNCSWTYDKWTTSAIHLDPNTWVLEYQSSSLQNSRILPLLWEFFRIKLPKKIKELWHGSSQSHSFSHNSNTSVGENLLHPT